jgi:hypothetical protein
MASVPGTGSQLSVLGQIVIFTATVTRTVSDAMVWTATCGTISGIGPTITYVAPTTPMACTIRATSVADPTIHASVEVSVLAPLSGELLWMRELGSPDSDERGMHLAIGAAGQVLFTGTTDGSPWALNHQGTAAVSGEVAATGASAWIHQFGWYAPMAISIAPDGRRLTAVASDAGFYLYSVSALGARLNFQHFRSSQSTTRPAIWCGRGA